MRVHDLAGNERTAFSPLPSARRGTYAKTPCAATIRQTTAILEAMLKIFRGKLQSVCADHPVPNGRSGARRLRGNLAASILAMPNKHYLLINLSPFGLENRQ